MTDRFGDHFGDEFGELAGIVADLAMNSVAIFIHGDDLYMCGVCGTGPVYRSESEIVHEPECPWIRAVNHRNRHASTVGPVRK